MTARQFTSKDARMLNSRRTFLTSTASGIGMSALASLLNENCAAFPARIREDSPRAKRIIYLFQSGGPSHCDLFDPKPALEAHAGKELPDSIRKSQRITTMTSKQDSLPILPSPYKFQQYGESGLQLSELLPHIGSHADDLCLVRSMHTEAINHDPAITFFQTGFQLAGRPSIGAWVSYGLGAINKDLPTYVALTSQGGNGSQPLYSRLWGSGFLPTKHAGVKLRNTGSPVFYLADPPGIKRHIRRDMLDDLKELNRLQLDIVADPEIRNRIEQYELAFRMQQSIPELADIADETKETLALYGPEVTQPGTFARNCLLARRLAERDVRFIQLFHMGWDHHTKLKSVLPKLTSSIDQPVSGLLTDLKRLGLLEDTLVVLCGEFGRTAYSQSPGENAGRDHHPYCFTSLLAGGGVKGGHVHGSTDDFGYNIAEAPVHVHDFNATILHLLGIEHEQLTYKYQGRQYRLTDVHGSIVRDILTS